MSSHLILRCGFEVTQMALVPLTLVYLPGMFGHISGRIHLLFANCTYADNGLPLCILDYQSSLDLVQFSWDPARILTYN